MKKDYERLGYSSDEVYIHLLKLTVTPLMVSNFVVCDYYV